MLLTALALAGTEVLQRAPFRPAVGAGEQVVFGPTFASFTRLELGSPLAYGQRGTLGLGITASASVVHTVVSDEERTYTGLQQVGGGLWVLFEPQTRTRHAFGITAAGSPTRGGWYGLAAQDAVSRYATFAYRLDHRGDRARFAVALDAGVDATGPVHLTLVPTFGVTLVRGLELETSGVIGFQSLAALGMGVRVTAWKGLEAGAGAFLLAGFDANIRVHAVPQLTLRYTAGWKKRFTRENGWREALEQDRTP